jgi:hypothetical protein
MCVDCPNVKIKNEKFRFQKKGCSYGFNRDLKARAGDIFIEVLEVPEA